MKKFELLFEGVKNSLLNEGRYFSELSSHGGEKGRLNESHLKRVLRQYLPSRYGIGTGFIVSSKSLDKSDNPQIDIVIYDALNNTPLYQSETFGIFPIEMVYVYIEVKTTLRNRDLKKILETNSRIRKLKDARKYASGDFNLPPPRFYLFAYKSVGTKESLIKALLDGFVATGDSHAHGVYVLDKDFLVARAALHDDKKVGLLTTDRAFPKFINMIGAHCSTMVQPQMLSFPLVNVDAYFPNK